MSDTEQSKEINTYETVCKIHELIDWVNKNKLKINITDIWYDYVFCDELITKIKELFKV